jgi:carbamoyl-phosphate synthase large subunit
MVFARRRYNLKSRSFQKQVLVTSISKKTPLLNLVRQALHKYDQEGKICGGDSKEECIGRYFVDEFWHMEELNNLQIEHFAEHCLQKGIVWVIPSRDGELLYYAQHKPMLASHGVAVMVSDVDAINKCLDKQYFYLTLAKQGFPAIVTSPDIKDIDAQQFVVKEQYGAGAARMGIRLIQSDALHHAKLLESPLFQPFIEGIEYSIDLYVDAKGKTKGVIARTRDVVVGGESQITTTVRYPDLEQMCAAAAETLGLYGHAVFQVIVDQLGKFHIIECNSRFGGASRLSVAAGLDSFFWFFMESTGQDLDQIPFVRSKEEMRMVRYAEDHIICL